MKKKRIGLLALVLILLFSTTALAAPKLAKKKVTLKTGNAYVLKLSGNKKSVKWTTSDKSVVQIVWKCKNRAVLRAKQEGTSTVTAKIGKKKLTCQVTVKKSPAFPSSRKVIVGDKFTLSTKKKGNWSITSGIARLSAKKAKKVTVTATAPGTAVIKVKVGKKTYKCKLTVITKKGTIPTPATGGGSTGTTTGGNTGTTTGGGTTGGGTTGGGTTGGSTSSGGGTTTGGTTGGTTSGDYGTSIPSGKWTMRVRVYEKGSLDYYEDWVNVEAGYTEERDLDVLFYGKEIPKDKKEALNAIQISVSDKSIASVTRADVVSVTQEDDRVLGKIKIKGLKEGTTKVTISPIKGREFNERSSYSFEVVVSKNLDEGRKLTEKLYSVFAIWEDSVVSDCSLSEEDPEEGLRNLCRYMCENYDYNNDGFPTIPGFIGSGGLWKAGLVKGMTDDNGNPDPRFGNGVNCDGSCSYINYFACKYLGCTSEPRYFTGGHVSEIVTTKDGTKYDVDCGMSGKKGSRLWSVYKL